MSFPYPHAPPSQHRQQQQSHSRSLSLQTANSALSTIHTRRRPRTPSLFLLFNAQPVKSTLPSPTPPFDLELPTYFISTPERSPRRFHGHSLPRPRPTPGSPPPPPTIDVELAFNSVEDDMQFTSQFPPTPAPSIHSEKMFMNAEAGPSSRLSHSLPPTPPVNADSEYDIVSPTSLAFDEPTITQRPRRGRRPASVYPFAGEEHVYQAQRKNTDRAAHQDSDESDDQQLDVDLDAYSTTDFDIEEDREPTLSFVTTSTVDSTAGTPASIGGHYEFKPEHGMVKMEGEPRIRLRSSAGRANAYSSAESSMASNAYSYHGYADNTAYQPPPLPALPSSYADAADEVGLGITGHDGLPNRQRDSVAASSPSTNAPISPSNSFAHRPWKRDVMTRLRSDSAASSMTTASASTEDSHHSVTAGSTSSHAYPFAGYAQNLPWERASYEQTAPEAVALVDEGKERIFDRETLEAMGGLDSLTDGNIASLRGVTHLLLPDVGSDLLHYLSTLLAVLAPTLVVLDLSDNYLSFLPETLQYCVSLEELNISNNPIRAVPAWVSELVMLRMMVLDGCLLQNLPADLSSLSNLHTLCVRRNRLVSLPSWLCLLSRLETLRIDENPFAAEWAPIVAPILASPPRPRSRPEIPSRSSSQRGLARSHGSVASFTSSRSSCQSRDMSTSGSAPQLGTDAMASPVSPVAQSMYHISGLGSIAEDHPHSAPIFQTQPMSQPLAPIEDDDDEPLPLPPPRGLRKMRSAGSLLNRSPDNTSIVSPMLSVFGNKSHARDSPESASSMTMPTSTSRFGSLGAKEGLRAASAMNHHNDMELSSPPAPRSAGLPSSTSTKTGKWGFLRKMSMNRLKADKPDKATLAASASANLHSLPPPLMHSSSDMGPAQPLRPSISVTRSAMTLPTLRTTGIGATPTMGEFGEARMPTSASTLPLGGLNALPSSSSIFATNTVTSQKRGKRRSFLPVDGPPLINIAIPSASPFMPPTVIVEETTDQSISTAQSNTSFVENSMTVSASRPLALDSPSGEMDPDSRYATGLESIKSYLRDLFDLSRQPIEPYGGFEVLASNDGSCVSSVPSEHPASPSSANTRGSVSEARRARRPTLETQISRNPSTVSVTESDKGCFAGTDFSPAETSEGKKFKNDKSKRARVLREIYETERTYVRGLGELVTIYVKPASQLVNQSKVSETIVPANERKVVFGGIESILSIHRENLLPALEKAVKPLLEGNDDDEGELSTRTAHAVGEVFRTYIAYMKQYSTYINNFDNALSRMQTWTAPSSAPGTPAFASRSHSANHPPSIASAVTALGAGMGGVTMNNNDSMPQSGVLMSTSQRKRVKTFLKRCREHPMHSQINLESYLLLPIQRVPRYKLLLEDLAMCTLPRSDGPRDTLDDALNEIASLASLMNEEKRDADSRLRLYHWQQRISSRGPSPLVQPHRKLIMDGALTLIRLVKKASSYVEVDSSGITDTDQTITSSKIVVPVEHIAPEPMDRPMMLVLCTDLLVLIQQRPGQNNWEGSVDLFNVLRMATLREPASIVHGNVLRVVDNKSIYYFNGTSQSETVKWCRAINTARRR